jgi:hypothetical protein
MTTSRLGKEFFRILDERIGPFDRPMKFRVFPFDLGGALNFLTIAAREDRFVTYVSWDLLGHPEQKRGRLGRYELLCTCDDETWCAEVLTCVGRMSLHEVFDPEHTLDIGAWVDSDACLQGLVFEEAFNTEVWDGNRREQCGLLRCIGVTRAELEFSLDRGVRETIVRLKAARIYPRTVTHRGSVI